VLGGAKTGRRPHFNFANARYSAEWLALHTDLLGKDLWLQIENEDDARFATVSDTRGHFLGIVRAAPPWHQTPHSLFVREAIRALERRRLLHLSTRCDAVEELIRHAEANDGKLPPHPAYLEVRRILVGQSEAVEAPRSIASAQNRSTPCERAPPNEPTTQVPSSINPEGRPRYPRNLPKAKTW